MKFRFSKYCTAVYTSIFFSNLVYGSLLERLHLNIDLDYFCRKRIFKVRTNQIII